MEEERCERRGTANLMVGPLSDLNKRNAIVEYDAQTLYDTRRMRDRNVTA